ncbi:uncharacterized protein LOC131005173 isoform X4 [Salvia miltiorrhiza]|uniref:uncharacterized protein LOC131005173 isoform X4 n=1 Tax=Salvia miltiorrhiza TaxID=226208 RepID=UPI0025ABA6C9|nr:uncharacterized protein LOC131005173 isoform X4 [Salvia miltiorrhiza]
MGIATSMGLLKFALLGVDLLGWPVIALGFPLFASIRAVESGSRYHMRKLVIYWTLFSLFSLFEFAFEKIIDWIPFWSGVRLIVSFSLVMPQFEGACLAYQGLVRSVIDRFGMLKEGRLCKRENFWDVVEKYINENGPEALEKLIALEMTRPEARVENRHPETPPRKKSQQEWTCHLCKVTNMGESTLNAHLQGSQHKSKLMSLKASLLDEKDTGPSFSRQVQHAHSFSAAWDLKGTYAAAEFKERMTPKEPENPLLKKAQQEWTCDLCKVTTASKSMLNAHLQGSKHKSKLESPKGSLLDAKDTGPSPLVQHTQSVSAACDLNGTCAAAEFKEVMPPTETAEKWRIETPLLKKAQPEWTCDLCKVTTMSEITLSGHLQGRRHKAKLDTILKESLLDAKDTGPCSPLVQHAQSVSAAWDLNGTYAPFEDKEISLAQETAEKRLPETPLFKKAQQEWTGDLCKVTTESDSTLNDHLQGSNHKSKLETNPEANLLDAKDTGPSPPVQHAQSVSAACNLNGTPDAAEVKEVMPPKETADKWQSEIPLLKKAQPEWTCDLCEVTTMSEITLNGHLQGREHKAKLETILKKSLFDAKDAGPSTALQVQHAQSVSAAWDLNGTYAPFEDKEISLAQETAEKRLPETPLFKKAQQEWTGDLCKVTTESDSTLNDHLQGSNHKSKLETNPEANLLDAKDTGPSPPVQHAQSVSAACNLNGTPDAAEVKEVMPPKETADKWQSEIPLLKKAQPEWTCDLCEVTTMSEITLNGHLQGREHKAKLETILKKSLFDAKDAGPSTALVQQAQPVSAAWDLNGTFEAAEDKEIMTPKETAKRRLPETPLLKKAQQECTGDLCKVTTECESALNDHLQGSYHKSNLETTLEASLLDEKDTGPSPPVVPHTQSVSAAWALKGMYAAAEVEEMMPPKATAETPLRKKAQPEWTCDLCKVTTPCEITLNGHLKGRKHKAKLESILKESLIDAKVTGPSSPLVQHAQSVSAAWDLNGTYAAFEDKEISPPQETAEKSLPETPSLKKAQQEWTGDLCEVATESESTLNDYLQGSNHKSKLETILEASLLDAKDTGPSPSVKHAQSVSAEVREIIPPKETAEKRGPETPLLKKTQREWTCDLCKVTTTSKITLNAHLQGGKHKAKLDANLKDSLNELEKLNASKTGHVECSNSHRDVKVIESNAKNGSSTSQEVQYAQSNEIPKRTYANAEVKETMPPPEARRAETPPLKKEWRCGLCRVKVTCEKNLNDHLQGSKHKSELESVKQWKEWSCGLCSVKVTCEKNLNDHLLGSKHKSKIESLKQWKGKLVVLEVNGECKHVCIICNTKLHSDVDLASHVKGKLHASNIAEMEKLKM